MKLRRPSRRVVLVGVTLAIVSLVAAAYVGLRATGLAFVEKIPVRFALPLPTGAF